MYRSFLAIILGAFAALLLLDTPAKADPLVEDIDQLVGTLLTPPPASGLGPLATLVVPKKQPPEADIPSQAHDHAHSEAGQILPPLLAAVAPEDAGQPDLASAAVNDEPGVDPERMRPIEITAPTTEALALYPANDRLVSPFGQGITLACEGLMEWLAPRRGGRWHSGLDLVPRYGRTRGRKLYAPGEGYVLRRRDWHPAWGSYLLAVFRKGDKLYLTGFFHLKARSHAQLQERNMAKGITGRITRGQLLGRVGRTGAARGAHLHLDVIQVREVVAPDQLPRVVWQGRHWSEFVHPATVIDGLPKATFRGRSRPNHGLIVRAYQPASKARPS